MLTRKLICLSGFVIFAVITVLTQIPVPSAKAEGFSPFGLASQWNWNAGSLAFFNFRTADAASTPLPQTVQFSTTTNSAAEGTNATIILQRQGDSIGPVSAKVTITDGTTTPADYRFSPGVPDNFDPNLTIAFGRPDVESIVVQPDGKVLLGGIFGTVAPNGGVSVTRNNVARLNSDGTVDAFDPNANAGIRAIALQADGKILIGGDFTSVSPNGGPPVARNFIARFNSDGTLDTSFDPSSNNLIRTITIQPDGQILVGGNFTNIGGASRSRIARLDATTGLADGFSPNANRAVFAISVQADGKVLAGGDFTVIGGAGRNRIARLDSTSGAADSWNPSSSDRIFTIPVLADGRILVGGDFGTIGGQARGGVARLDPVTGLADAFNGGANNTVVSLAVQPDGKIVAGGSFTSIGGATRNRIARLDPNTGAADSFNPKPDLSVYAVALQADGKILFGGEFTTISPNGGAPVGRNRIARVDGDLFLTWPDGDISEKTLLLPIVADGLVEPDETLTLTVTPLTAGVTVGANNQQTLTVPADGPPAPLSITPSSVGVENGVTQTFAAVGGSPPYAFSILTNNSGGTINATTGAYTAGTTAGVTDTVRVTDAFGATADATVSIFGTPNKLAFSVQPTNAVAGQAISPSVQITVQDASGNTVTNSTAAITLSIQNNPNAGTLLGTLSRNAVNGIATFDNLSINRAGDGYTLRAASGALTTATSSAFNITAGVANRLAFVVQPSNVLGGSIISPSVQVAIQDAVGNIVTAATDQITIGIGNNPATGILSGTLTHGAVDGVATFNNLRIDTPGVGYTLVTSSGTLPGATSVQFDVSDQFQVINTNNAGAGSLRQAIINAAAVFSTNRISFNIPGNGPHLIVLASQLPAVGASDLIDGTTQPGYSNAPVVGIHSANGSIVTGLDLSGGNTVKALTVSGPMYYAIRMQGQNSTVQGCFLGVNFNGTSLQNGAVVGVQMRGQNSLVGGSVPLARNVISGNTVGIEVLGGSGNAITGNYIGTDASGSVGLPNHVGIGVLGSDGSNVVSRVTIGGDSASDENRIAFNRAGITVFKQLGTPTATIKRNSIHSNSPGLGIDLKGSSGVTPNDPQDGDAGPNGLQNFPVLTSAFSSSGNTTINGSLNSIPLRSYTLNFYSSSSCDASGFGEGETFIGSTEVSTDGGGISAFSAQFAVTSANGSVITATATDADGNTSEFSRCSSPVADAVFSVSGQITDGTGNPVSNVLLLTSDNRNASSDSNGNYVFPNIPAGTNFTITPSRPRFTFTPAALTISNLSTNLTNQNFAALTQSTILGRVGSFFNGSAYSISGITISLSGAGNQTVQTDNNGEYRFGNLSGGNYVVTPSRDNFTFTPGATNVALSNVDKIVSFTATPLETTPGRIAFVVNQGISVMNPDGSAQVMPVTNSTGCGKPLFSRDGSKIVATCPGTTTNSSANLIVAMNFDGSNLRTVSSTGVKSSPAWSPDGAKIAFVEGNTFTNSLRIINNDGTGLTTVHSGNLITSPAWSPDGTKIIFSKLDLSGATVKHIFVVNTDGSGLTQLTATQSDTIPAFSPDGSKIVFLRTASSSTPFPGNIFVMNADGTGQTQITSTPIIRDIAWSPDGSRLAFLRGNSPNYGTMNPDGTNVVNLANAMSSATSNFGISWGSTFAPPTGVGTSVSVSAGAINVNFASVSAAGQTTVIPIPPNSAGTLPGGYVIGTQAYEISTTANVSPPITVCFTVPTTIATTETAFNLLSVMHNEGGSLIDRTSSRNLSTRSICATSTSLSPFALAAQTVPNSPRISGVIINSSGDPMSGVSVNLTGAATQVTQTDGNGVFNFVNLTAGGNYNVAPKQIGYLFSEYNQDFVNLSDEQTVIFEGVAANFGISGTITDGAGNGLNNVSVEIDGAALDSVETDSNGNYVFAALPADGFFSVRPTADLVAFAPQIHFVSPLTSDVGGVDFQAFAPTAANVSISGRILNPSGQGLRNAIVTLLDQSGLSRQTRSSSFGYYHFDGVEAGNTYIITVASKRYVFQPRTVSVNDEIVDFDLTGTEP